MKKSLVILYSILAFILGCAAVTYTTAQTLTNNDNCTKYWDPSSFPIKVSPAPDFTESEIKALGQAVDWWNYNVGERILVLSDSFYEPRLNLFAEGITFEKKPLDGEFVGFCPSDTHLSVEGDLGRVRYAYCSIDVLKVALSSKPKPLKNLMAHELGHALGLKHDMNDKYSIMSPNILAEIGKLRESHLIIIRLMFDGTLKHRNILGMPTCK